MFAFVKRFSPGQDVFASHSYWVNPASVRTHTCESAVADASGHSFSAFRSHDVPRDYKAWMPCGTGDWGIIPLVAWGVRYVSVADAERGRVTNFGDRA